MTQEEIKQNIGNFVAFEVGGSDNIESIEENCGSMWIETKDGKTYSISIMECEPDQD